MRLKGYRYFFGGNKNEVFSNFNIDSYAFVGNGHTDRMWHWRSGKTSPDSSASIAEDFAEVEDIAPNHMQEDAAWNEAGTEEDHVASGEEEGQQLSINVYPLMRSDFNEVRDLFGDEISSGEGLITSYEYLFDTGIFVGVNDYGEIISLNILLGDKNFARYHFNGISGNSAYTDVIALLGDEPFNINEGISNSGEPIKSYGYWVVDHEFVRFSFDTNDDVVSISFFLAERPPSE